MAGRARARSGRIGPAMVLLVAGLTPAAARPAEPADGGHLPPTVAIRSPDGDDPDLQAAALRIRAELEAAGVRVSIVECPPEEDLAACDGTAAARVALRRFDGVVTVEIVGTMGTGLSVRRRVQVAVEPGADEAALLAVRATELLRDLYLDVRRAPPAPARAPQADVTVARPPVPSPSRFSLGISTGVALLEGRRGLGPSLAPASVVSLGMGAHLSLLAAIAAPFSERLVGSVGTAANVRQGVGYLGARYELGQGRLRPYGMLAAGLHYLQVRGETTHPLQIALTSSAWAPLIAGGLGASMMLGRWFFVGAEASLFFTEPSSVVTAGSARVGTAGAPSFLASLSLGARLPLSVEERER